jgi:hypothetical protein
LLEKSTFHITSRNLSGEDNTSINVRIEFNTQALSNALFAINFLLSSSLGFSNHKLFKSSKLLGQKTCTSFLTFNSQIFSKYKK